MFHGKHCYHWHLVITLNYIKWIGFLKGYVSFFIHLNVFLQQYDSSSLPALLFKARPLLRAENHLQNINYQLENLLDQK